MHRGITRAYLDHGSLPVEPQVGLQMCNFQGGRPFQEIHRESGKRRTAEVGEPRRVAAAHVSEPLKAREAWATGGSRALVLMTPGLPAAGPGLTRAKHKDPEQRLNLLHLLYRGVWLAFSPSTQGRKLREG